MSLLPNRQKAMPLKLSDLIKQFLDENARFFWKSGWRGKEHDCVNLFAHRFLAKRVRPFDRIGIEVAVPQLGSGSRRERPGKTLCVRFKRLFWDDFGKSRGVSVAFHSPEPRSLRVQHHGQRHKPPQSSTVNQRSTP